MAGGCLFYKDRSPYCLAEKMFRLIFQRTLFTIVFFRPVWNLFFVSSNNGFLKINEKHGRGRKSTQENSTWRMFPSQTIAKYIENRCLTTGTMQKYAKNMRRRSEFAQKLVLFYRYGPNIFFNPCIFFDFPGFAQKLAFLLQPRPRVSGPAKKYFV